MKIRRGHIDDIESIAQLFDDYRVWYRKDPDIEQAISFLTDRLNYNESVIYVADLDGTLAGFTQLYPIFSSTRMKRMWLLNDLYVTEKHRQQGIAKALIEKAKKLSNQTLSAGILLETEQSNEIGNHLYPSLGFKKEENNFYFWS